MNLNQPWYKHKMGILSMWIWINHGIKTIWVLKCLRWNCKDLNYLCDFNSLNIIIQTNNFKNMTSIKILKIIFHKNQITLFPDNIYFFCFFFPTKFNFINVKINLCLKWSNFLRKLPLLMHCIDQMCQEISISKKDFQGIQN